MSNNWDHEICFYRESVYRTSASYLKPYVIVEHDRHNTSGFIQFTSFASQISINPWVYPRSYFFYHDLDLIAYMIYMDMMVSLLLRIYGHSHGGHYSHNGRGGRHGCDGHHGWLGCDGHDLSFSIFLSALLWTFSSLLYI